MRLLFSKPAKYENISTATGVKAFNICMYDTDRYMYALFENIKLMENNIATGTIRFLTSSYEILFAFAAGNIDVVRDIT